VWVEALRYADLAEEVLPNVYRNQEVKTVPNVQQCAIEPLLIQIMNFYKYKIIYPSSIRQYKQKIGFAGQPRYFIGKEDCEAIAC
jgi:hypothetical protein